LGQLLRPQTAKHSPCGGPVHGVVQDYEFGIVRLISQNKAGELDSNGIKH
jgi:hypothetical protein